MLVDWARHRSERPTARASEFFNYLNIWLKFTGWFQCRLATDPDPTDEPRGVSGYVRAVAGEPDLDRILRLQPPVVQRSYCPQVGVRVSAVFGDSRYLTTEHPLIGTLVEFLDDPKFEANCATNGTHKWSALDAPSVSGVCAGITTFHRIPTRLILDSRVVDMRIVYTDLISCKFSEIM